MLLAAKWKLIMGQRCKRVDRGSPGDFDLNVTRFLMLVNDFGFSVTNPRDLSREVGDVVSLLSSSWRERVVLCYSRL